MAQFPEAGELLEHIQSKDIGNVEEEGQFYLAQLEISILKHSKSS
jgi:hypothetical protein